MAKVVIPRVNMRGFQRTVTKGNMNIVNNFFYDVCYF